MDVNRYLQSIFLFALRFNGQVNIISVMLGCLTEKVYIKRIIQREDNHPPVLGASFVWVDALHPSQQSFSRVRTIPCLPGLNQYYYS